MITTEKTLKDFGFKYLFDYGIKPNHYEIYRRDNKGYFFVRTKENLLEEVGHLRFQFGEFQNKYIYEDVRFHHDHNETMNDIESLEGMLHVNRECDEPKEESIEELGKRYRNYRNYDTEKQDVSGTNVNAYGEVGLE